MTAAPSFFERHRLALLAAGALVLLRRAVRGLSRVPDEAAVLRAARGSLNLLVGYVGLLSFGHAMFFGSAGYATAHAVKVWGFDAALACSSVRPWRRRSAPPPACWRSAAQGIAFSMITLAFAQLVYFVALRSPFTGGEDGIQNVPRGKLLRPAEPQRQPRRCTTW